MPTQPLAPPESSWSGRRADARRNHERVLAAAIEVFTEHGLGATIPQVAARAGVGKATVYRSYPTKAALVTALEVAHVDWLTSLIAAAARRTERDDAFEVLEELLLVITARLAEDRLFVEVLTRVEGWADTDETENAVQLILSRGKEQGTLRADVTEVDLQVLVGGFARVLLELEVRDPEVWQRYTRLTLAALRA